MKKTMCGIAAILCCLAAGAQNQTRQDRLTDHVYYFASDTLNGRKAGSADAARVADYIAGQYEAAGLVPFFEEGWFDPFEVSYPRPDVGYKNVVGVIKGSDPKLQDEYIVLGAHYDHLGVKNGKVYNGADDNASGSASLIEVARTLAADRECLGRSVIIAAFDAEELGLYGSSHLASRLDSLGVNVKLMMSIDMVGWLKTNQALELEGTATIKDGRRILEDEASKVSLTIKPQKYERSIFTATDTEGFAKRGVPTLAVSTGLKSPYHKPEDDADLIDYQGLDLVTEYIGNLTEGISADESFASSGKVAPKHRTKSDIGVDFGAVAGFNTTNLQFADGGVSTYGRYGWAAGAELQFNYRSLGLWVDALYNQANSKYPDTADLFSSSYKYERSELLVPVSLVLQTARNNLAGFYIGAGAYWSKAFSTEVKGLAEQPEFKDNLIGWNFCFGMKVANFQLGLTTFSQGNIFNWDNSPKSRQECVMCTLKYMFF